MNAEEGGLEPQTVSPTGRRARGRCAVRAFARCGNGGGHRSFSPPCQRAGGHHPLPGLRRGGALGTAKCFDLLGGIGSLVKDKTVTVKINLTGTDFSQFLGRPVGETFMTHYDTALALGALLFANGAKRVRLVESTQSKSKLQGSLVFADWDARVLEALGKVEFENTRNLGPARVTRTPKSRSAATCFRRWTSTRPTKTRT